MGRWRWLASLVDPIFMGAVAVSIVVPLLLVPAPAGPVIALGLVAFVGWVNHRMERSIDRLPIQNGPEAMIGRSARVVQSLDPEGLVQCGSETWQAREIRGRRVESGRQVKVIGVSRLELQVERQ